VRRHASRRRPLSKSWRTRQRERLSQPSHAPFRAPGSPRLAHNPATRPVQRPHKPRARVCGRCTGPVPARSPCCLRGCAGAAPPPCSRPHPLKEQEGEVGNTPALLREQKGSRRKVVQASGGNPGTPPSTPSGPVPMFPPDPPPDLPANDTRHRTYDRGSVQAPWPAPRRTADRGSCKARRDPAARSVVEGARTGEPAARMSLEGARLLTDLAVSVTQEAGR
jgi:hypothetical protein